MSNKTKSIIGIILIIIAVVAVIGSQQLYQQAREEARDKFFSFGSRARYMSDGSETRTTADIIKYGGFGIGAIGTVLFLVGLLKKAEK